MKKLRLKALTLGAKEILSREQLKSINGGCVISLDCTNGMRCINNNCTAVGSDYDPSDPFTFPGGSGSSNEQCDDLTYWCEMSQHCVMFEGEC